MSQDDGPELESRTLIPLPWPERLALMKGCMLLVRFTTLMPTKRKNAKPGCAMPTRPLISALHKVVLDRVEHEERSIREYVEWQLGKGVEHGAKVLHLEKIKSERVCSAGSMTCGTFTWTTMGAGG